MAWRGGAEGRWRLAARTRCSGLNWAMGESKVVEAARSEQSSKRRLLQPPSCPLPPLGGASVVAKKTGRAPLEKSGGRQWESKRPFAKKNLLQTFLGAEWK